jgi:hypothetical protein
MKLGCSCLVRHGCGFMAATRPPGGGLPVWTVIPDMPHTAVPTAAVDKSTAISQAGLAARPPYLATHPRP